MEIKVTTEKNENGTLITLDGKLNTLTAQDVAKEFDAVLPQTNDLTIDIKNVDYVSSAGLRLFVTAQKKMKAQSGNMTIKNVQEAVLEIFTMTGLTGVFNIVNE